MPRFLLSLLSLACLAMPLPCAAASFDCARAASPDERAVCADKALSELDTALGRANEQARASTKPAAAGLVRTAARGVMAERRACGAERSCLLVAYLNGLDIYRNFGSSVPVPDWLSALEIAGGDAPERSALPVRVSQCATTRVASVTARLEGEPPGSFESGTAINFANDGRQVSYDAEPPLIASRPGDRVVMCLTFIPRNCPRGDDRGKVYRVTNLRTHESWTMPDSQHECGGA